MDMLSRFKNEWQRIEFENTPIYIRPARPDWFVPNTAADQLLTDGFDNKKISHEIRLLLNCHLEKIVMAKKPTYEELEQRVRSLEQDVLKLKWTEEVLSKSEERFRIIFNNAPQGIALANQSGRFLKVNSAWENMFGYNEKESQQLTIQGITSPEDIKISTEKLADLFRRDIGCYRFEKRFKRKDGSIFWGDLSVSLIHDLENGFKIALGVVVDITERKRSVNALRESEGKLNAMLQSIGDHISMMDEDLNIIWTNKTAEKIFGKDIIGKKCYEVYHQRKESCEPYPCITLKAFRDGKVHKHDTQVIDQYGKKMFFHCTANVALRDKEGKPTAVMELSRDITDQKQAESALIERGKELENKTHELEEVNAALKVLLKHRDEDQQHIEEKIVANVKELVLPYVEKLNNSRLNDRQMVYLNIIKSNLEDIITPFLHQLSSKYFNLTPREIQIAGLVKDGKTTKEIAELLNSSTGTIDFHRNNLRKKLGLRNTKTNLRSFLLALP